jgi:hypothetical protein
MPLIHPSAVSTDDPISVPMSSSWSMVVRQEALVLGESVQETPDEWKVQEAPMKWA